MIYYRDGKEYWNGNECTAKYLRALSRNSLEIYVELIRSRREYLKFHTVATCHCGYKWIVDDSAIPSQKEFEEACPSCGRVILLKKYLDGKSYPIKDPFDVF